MKKSVLILFALSLVHLTTKYVFAQDFQTKFHELVNDDTYTYGLENEPSEDLPKDKFAMVIFRPSFSAGDYSLQSNQEYIDYLTISRGTFSWDLEFFPFKNIGIGGSLITSSLNEKYGEHLLNGNENTREIYGILRTGPFDENKGYMGFYFGGGNTNIELTEADPEFFSEEIMGNGRSAVFGLIIQYFGSSRVGLTLDASYRSINIPNYFFRDTNESFLTFNESNSPLHTNMYGFSLKLGLAILLF